MSFQVLPKVPVHPTEELLEEYSFGRVREPLLTPLEEHLLLCVECQITLEELDDYGALMKTITRSWERENQHDPAVSLPWLRIPKPSGNVLLATGLVAIFASAAGLISHQSWSSKRGLSGAPSDAPVKLSAMRGGNADGPMDGLALGKAGRPLDLAIDGTHLAQASGYRLQLVNESGREIWSGIPQVNGTRLSAHVADRFARGVYWVRLYSSTGDLLREFGMRLQ